MSMNYDKLARKILGPPREYARAVLEKRLARAIERAALEGKVEVYDRVMKIGCECELCCELSEELKALRTRLAELKEGE